MEQRRCTGRRPPWCSSCFFQTVFKIIYSNCSSNIGVSCCVQIQLEGTSVGNLFLIEKEKTAGRPFPFQNAFSFFRQPCSNGVRVSPAVPLFGCLCYTMWAMPLCNACLFCIRSMLAGNKQPGSWSCFACHSHETNGDAFLPRQQSTGSAQRRGSPLTVGLPYIFCHTSYRNLASFASFPASCHCTFRAGRVYAEELDAGP